MRTLVVGLGTQGSKRIKFIEELAGSVDPVNTSATFSDISKAPVDTYDAVFLCVPDKEKPKLIEYCIQNRKHVLVEKPLLSNKIWDLNELQSRAVKSKVFIYTAYNHRFEPNFVLAKEYIDSGVLGQIYSARIFYGNGTARLVKNSPWRDQGVGVLPDLGSHLLDTALFWFNQKNLKFKIQTASCFENNSLDYVAFGANGLPTIQLEATLLSWKNHFYADIFAEFGSLHLSSLCKWGPSSITIRTRKLPSGKPDEHTQTLIQDDPTWKIEYEYFKKMCFKGESNIENDIWINQILSELSSDI